MNQGQKDEVHVLSDEKTFIGAGCVNRTLSVFNNDTYKCSSNLQMIGGMWHCEKLGRRLSAHGLLPRIRVVGSKDDLRSTCFWNLVLMRSKRGMKHGENDSWTGLELHNFLSTFCTHDDAHGLHGKSEACAVSPPSTVKAWGTMWKLWRSKKKKLKCES